MSTLQMTRAALEHRIEDLIALLDLLDGDENLEPYLADADPYADDREADEEREIEETDQNGDESDYDGTEKDGSVGRLEGGSGI